MDDRLAAVVVADPVETVARAIAHSCARFATKNIVVATGEQALRVASELRPQLAILSLELREPAVVDIIRELRRHSPQTHIAVTFRELTGPETQRLTKLGIEDLLPQPLDPEALARLVWLRFKINSRAYARYDVARDVRRAGGPLLGRTRNLSEGGMLLGDVTQPITSGLSLLIDLMLPNDQPLRVRGAVLAAEGQIPSPMWARLRLERLRGSEHERLAVFLHELAEQQALAAPLAHFGLPDEMQSAFGEKPVVFVIDLEPETLALLTRTLRASYEVVIFKDPNAALDAAMASPPALIITDQWMPNLTGTELVRKLEEAGVGCPTIMVTASPELAEIVEARAKFFNVVPKPVMPEDLLACARIAISSFRVKAATSRLGKLGTHRPPRAAKGGDG
jgi:DNA-binding NtrC family response regulator